jgi:hypothetical protein
LDTKPQIRKKSTNVKNTFAKIFLEIIPNPTIPEALPT